MIDLNNCKYGDILLCSNGGKKYRYIQKCEGLYPHLATNVRDEHSKKYFGNDGVMYEPDAYPTLIKVIEITRVISWKDILDKCSRKK